MKTIHIKNYKNLEDLRIDNLGQVNLITGKNNAGKSTLLEAIAIVCEGNVPASIFVQRGEKQILQEKTEEAAQIDFSRYSTLFPNNNTEVSEENKIEISTIGEEGKNNHSISFHFAYYKKATILNDEKEEQVVNKIVEKGVSSLDNDIKIGLWIASINKGYLHELGSVPDFRNSITETIKENGKLTLRGHVSFKIRNSRYEYVHSTEIDSSDNAKRYDTIVLNGKEGYVINALQLLDPTIEQLIYLSGVPYVGFKGIEKKQRLSSMGDGINRILTIILAMLNCKDGVLLIDEFENGLHYSVQSKLWEVIFKLSEELNVQVFATTHSSDTIRSFIRENKTDTGRFIRLEKRKGKIVSVSYQSREKMLFILSQNIEIR